MDLNRLLDSLCKKSAMLITSVPGIGWAFIHWPVSVFERICSPPELSCQRRVKHWMSVWLPIPTSMSFSLSLVLQLVSFGSVPG